MECIGRREKTEIHVRVGNTNYTVNALGAELASWMIGGKERIHQKEALWPRHAPILFPFVGKLEKQQYVWENHTYPVGAHGFLRDRVFHFHAEKSEETEDRAVLHFSYRSTYSDRKFFPWGFSAHIQYTLEERRFRMDVTIRNASPTEMYFAIGFHPGFVLPELEKLHPLEEYALAFGGRDSLKRFDISMKTGLLSTLKKEDVPLKEGLFHFSEHSLQEKTWFFADAGHSVDLVAKSGQPYLHLESDLAHLGIWQPSPLSDFVCLEPWSSMPGFEGQLMDVANWEDRLRLGTRDAFSCYYAVELFL